MLHCKWAAIECRYISAVIVKPKGGLKLISGWTDALRPRLTECFSLQSTLEDAGAKMCEVMTKRADNNVKSKVKAKLWEATRSFSYDVTLGPTHNVTSNYSMV